MGAVDAYPAHKLKARCRIYLRDGRFPVEPDEGGMPSYGRIFAKTYGGAQSYDVKLDDGRWFEGLSVFQVALAIDLQPLPTDDGISIPERV